VPAGVRQQHYLSAALSLTLGGVCCACRGDRCRCVAGGATALCLGSNWAVCLASKVTRAVSAVSAAPTGETDAHRCRSAALGRTILKLVVSAVPAGEIDPSAALGITVFSLAVSAVPAVPAGETDADAWLVGRQHNPSTALRLTVLEGNRHLLCLLCLLRLQERQAHTDADQQHSGWLSWQLLCLLCLQGRQMQMRGWWSLPAAPTQQ
jgi:hypothetical protein